jgi:hypothetical protein
MHYMEESGRGASDCVKVRVSLITNNSDRWLGNESGWLRHNLKIFICEAVDGRGTWIKSNCLTTFFLGFSLFFCMSMKWTMLDERSCSLEEKKGLYLYINVYMMDYITVTRS